MKCYRVTYDAISGDDDPHTPMYSSISFDSEEAAKEWLAKNPVSPEATVTEVEYLTYGILDAQMEEFSTWTMEQAIEAETLWREEKKSGRSPMHQWSVLKNHLPHCREGWEAGDSKALLLAVALCGSAGLPLPPWCATAIFEITGKINRLEETSWDKALGAPHKGRKVSLLKNQENKRRAAVMEVFHLVEQDPPIPVGKAINKVAAEYKVSIKLLEEWYYEWE